MSINLAKVIKEEFADDLEVRARIEDAVRRFLSSCADDVGDDKRYYEDCQIFVQPRIDGMLAIIGTLDMEPTPYYRSEIIDHDVEYVMPVETFLPSSEPVDPAMMTR